MAKRILNVDLFAENMLTCPVCGKTFEKGPDTKYIIAGGYVCDWKCFLDEMKRREANKPKVIDDGGKKRGRKPKS